MLIATGLYLAKEYIGITFGAKYNPVIIKHLVFIMFCIDGTNYNIEFLVSFTHYKTE